MRKQNILAAVSSTSRRYLSGKMKNHNYQEKETLTRKVKGVKEHEKIFSALEDLDFADDLALVSHTHQHMQEKTSRLG